MTADTSQIDAAVKDLLRAQTPSVRREANTYGAAAAVESIRDHYSATGRNLWINPALPTHGPGRKLTGWWKLVESSWFVGNVTGNGARFANGTIGLAHKVTGGTIKAKRKKFLTIPIVPEAHGVSAKDYARQYKPLFAAKGFLMEATDDPEKPRAVYALRKSVTQKPWPNALPPDDTYTSVFMREAVRHIVEVMEGKS